METSKNANIPIPVLVVLYDFRYMWKDNREVCVKKGEKLLLLEKTNKDWWQVVRPSERKSFFVPAQYVKLLKEKKEGSFAGSSSAVRCDDSVLYENIDILKQKIDIPSNVRRSDIVECKLNRLASNKFSQEKQKPVPKTRTKVSTSRNHDEVSAKSKSNLPNAKYPYVEGDLDKFDKSDKLKINDKKRQDFIPSLSKELNPSTCLQSVSENYREKSASVAVENLVYCNVPLGDDKNLIGKQKVKSSDVFNKTNAESGKNRMKNSYNLNTKSTKTTELYRQAESSCTEKKPSSDFPKLNPSFSKSLEKLAEEIQFEPKKVSVGTKSLSVENYTKTKFAKMAKENLEKKQEKRGKTNDASVVLDENKIQPQSRSVFSRFRRSLHHSSSFKSNNLKKLGKSPKKACELSLSWEGGLDKIQEQKEKEEKPQLTPLGLQRSRTFMIAERSPLSLRPMNKIFSGKHRLDTAYHSQRKPEEKIMLSTFKPIFNLDITHQSPGPIKRVLTKEAVNKYNLEREKLQKSILEQSAESKIYQTVAKQKVEKNDPKTGYESVTKVTQNIQEYELGSQTVGQEGLTFYNEPYSNSESEDNLEEKSLAVIAEKSLRSQSSIDSNNTLSEETEASESDENGSFDFKLKKDGHTSPDHPANKRRTSLVRSSRVESSRVRKVTARLPSTPPSEQKPMKDLGDGWGVYVSKGGRSYYYNENTGEKNWKPPRRIVNLQEKRTVSSHESVYSDLNRSDTSSPLNENCHLLNSLDRSNGPFHSKSGGLENSSFETSKSGSITRWKENSADDLNRSSYNSSPVTGLSQSSTYSLNKSSRDSLNRFSPIENIPSEEEGLELQDHVYQDELESIKRDDQLKSDEEEDSGITRSSQSKGSKRVDTSSFHVHPGWEEFYEESSDQIYYMYKDKKEKVS